jgi:hypothetical protein
MTAAARSTGAPSGLPKDWKSIEWKKVQKAVRRLQMRIAKAVRKKLSSGHPDRESLWNA